MNAHRIILTPAGPHRTTISLCAKRSARPLKGGFIAEVPTWNLPALVAGYVAEGAEIVDPSDLLNHPGCKHNAERKCAACAHR